jgi:hypothetical protein
MGENIMSRKRSQHHSQNKAKKPKNQTLYLAVTAIIIIAAIAALILAQEPSNINNANTNDTSTDTNDGTWLFAMDTPTEYVGGYGEYNTGYIPTLIIIDVDGNIVHKSAGVHSKDDLIQYVQEAEESSTGRTPAPDFTLDTLHGNQFTLSDHRGTPIILDLMAVRCPPCEQQMPELQKVKKELGDDVVILSIDVDGAGGYESAQDVIEAFGEYVKEE